MCVLWVAEIKYVCNDLRPNVVRRVGIVRQIMYGKVRARGNAENCMPGGSDVALSPI